MFASIVFADGRTAHFEFGEELDPQLPPVPFYRRMLADYDRRRDELWDVPLHQAWPALLELLQENRPDVLRLRTTVRALGDLGWFEPANEVAPLVEHEDRGVRLAAVKALGQMAVFSTIRRVGGFLLPETPMEFRRAATVALGKYGLPILLDGARVAAGGDADLLALAAQAKTRAAAHAEKNYHRVVAAVLPTSEYYDLHSWQSFVRLPLVAVVADPARDDELRARACGILATQRYRKVAPAMVRFATDENVSPESRAEVVCGIGRCRLPRTAPTVIPMLDADHEGLQYSAVVALGRLGDAAARVPLLAHWDAREGALRPELRVALRRVSPTDGAMVLMTNVRSQIDFPVVSAAFLLNDQTRAAGLPRDALLAQLASPVGNARRDAALLLAFYGTPADVPALVTARDREGDVRLRPLLEQLVERVIQRPGVPIPPDAPWES